jgi:DNA/RNA endonuclease G (NUC1)
MSRVFPILLFVLVVQSVHATIDASLQMQLGNPSGAIVDTNNHDHYLIQRTVEALDYSDNLGEPNWASWDLTASDIGSSGRSDFLTDTTLPPNFNWVGTADYTDSGYNRGHMCPSEDRSDNTNDNKLVFYMSNVIPQTADNNQGPWEKLESYCQSLAQSGDELLIMCGPNGFSGARINTNGPVFIPDYIWKIAVVVPPGSGSALSRITSFTRVIAVNMPNISGIRSVSWTNYITSVNQIQTNTGYTFFTALPPDVAAALRAEVDGVTILPPTLTIMLTNLNSIVLSWSSSSTNFMLQQNSDLTTTNWMDVTNSVIGQNQIILPLSSENSYFRLIDSQ